MQRFKSRFLASRHRTENPQKKSRLLNRLSRRLTFEPLEERRLLSAGNLDPTFGTNGKVTTNLSTLGTDDWATDILVVQEDGKILVAGNCQGACALARYNSDGTLDTGFGTEGKIVTSAFSASAVALQADGRIVVAGSAYQIGAEEDFAVARYLSDGSLDTSFGGDGLLTTDFGAGSSDYGNSVAIDGSGRIVVAGYSYQSDTYDHDFAVARYLSDGSLDTSFGGDGLVTTDFGSGSSDNGGSVAIDDNGRIVVAGYSYQSDAYEDFAVARYLADGNLDASFGAGGLVTTDFASGSSDCGNGVAIDDSGRVVVAGYSYQSDTGSDFAVARYLSDGTLDADFDGGLVTTDFGAALDDSGRSVVIDSSGRIVVAGYSEAGGLRGDFAVARYESDGGLDAGLGGDGLVTTDFGTGSWEGGNSVAIDGSGRIVVAGYCHQSTTSTDFAVVRYDSSGNLDDGFGADGRVITNLSMLGTSDQATGVVVVQADGKILVVGNCEDTCALVRYNNDGSLDAGFGTGGKVVTAAFSASAIALQADGSIVVAGYSYQSGTGMDFAVARYLSDGSLDTSFGGNGLVTTDFGAGSDDSGRGVAIDGTGRIVVAGDSYQNGTHSYDFAVARYLSDGSLDTSFGAGGRVTTDFASSSSDYGNSVAIDGNGRIIVAGYSNQNGTGDDFAVARYLNDGTLDTSFGTGGLVTTDYGSGSADCGNGVAIDGSDRIIVAGYSNQNGTGDDFAVARYLTDGTLDAGFGGDGLLTTDFATGSDDSGRSVVIDGDGRIVVAGTSYHSGARADFAVTRYLSDGSLDAGFGGGGLVTEDFGFGSWDSGSSLAVDGNGQIVVAGCSYRPSISLDFALVRYDNSGNLDDEFGDNGQVITNLSVLGTSDQATDLVVVQDDGKIVVVGSCQDACALVRYNSNGTLDTSFGTDGKVVTSVFSASAVALQVDGRIVVAGYSYQSATYDDFAVARYLADGRLDTSFGSDGLVTTDFGAGSSDYANSVAIDNSGRIVVAGYSYQSDTYDYDFAVARYLGDGSLDAGFDGDGLLTTDFASGSSDCGNSVAIDGSGRVVVAGYSYQSDTYDYDFAVARYLADGSLDASFGADGLLTTDFASGSSDYGNSVAIDDSGRIVVAGYSYQSDTGSNFAVARYLNDGTLDAGFDGGLLTTDFGAGVEDCGRSVVIDGSGRIVVAGYSEASGSGRDFAVARYKSDGSLDAGFGSSGLVTTDFGFGSSDYGNGVAIDSNGWIVVAGYSRQPTTSYDFALARYQGFHDWLIIGDSTPAGGTSAPIDSMRFKFERAVDQVTFSLAEDVTSFTGPAGPIEVNGFTWLDARTLEVAFDPQTTLGVYQMTIGPDIRDTAGGAMDQDLDLTPGEALDDHYTATFTIRAPQIIGHDPAGMVLGPVAVIHFTFDTSMDTFVFLVRGRCGELHGAGGPYHSYRIQLVG